MRKLISFVAVLLATAAVAAAQSGPWSGSIDVNGTKLTLIFHFDGDSCTFDVPDQGAKDIPAGITRGADGKVTVSIGAIGATYEYRAFGNLLVGTFFQSGVELPLSLKPGIPKRNRPQTPKGPFPYTTEEVSFVNGDAVLKGTLTLPEGVSAKTPAVIMITGSGLQNRDEEIFEHKPFAVIADAFARAGFATLRYDDRGFAESTGDAATATSADLMNDALAGIALLRDRFDRVGVLGHSEGGTFALLLAADARVDFAISLAGMVISGSETLLQQNRDALHQAGISDSDTEMYVNALANAFDNALAGGPMPSLSDVPAVLRQNFEAVWAQINTEPMRDFLRLRVAGSVKKIKCPVLALNGSKDTQVDASKNLPPLESILKSRKSLISEQPDLNHLFQHCSTGLTSEYPLIDETFSPSVLTLITSWLSSL